MRVACTKRKRSDLRLIECSQYVQEIEQELTIGQSYIVYAQYLSQRCLFYLIATPNRNGLFYPSWYPASFFDVVDASIPMKWQFKYSSENEEGSQSPTSLWGYHELIQSENHFINLIERDEDALAIFWNRKAEIDQQTGVN